MSLNLLHTDLLQSNPHPFASAFIDSIIQYTLKYRTVGIRYTAIGYSDLGLLSLPLREDRDETSFAGPLLPPIQLKFVIFSPPSLRPPFHLNWLVDSGIRIRQRFLVGFLTAAYPVLLSVSRVGLGDDWGGDLIQMWLGVGPMNGGQWSEGFGRRVG